MLILDVQNVEVMVEQRLKQLEVDIADIIVENILDSSEETLIADLRGVF